MDVDVSRSRRRGSCAAAVLVVLPVLLCLFTAPQAWAAQALISDDFAGPALHSRWSVVDPVGDGTVSTVGSGTADAHLELTIPTGTGHDPWNVNRSLRVMQTAADVDLGLEAKFDSLPTARYQMQGITVQQDLDDWLRFEIYSDGSVLRAFAASTTSGVSSVQLSKAVPAAPSSRLRVERTASAWTLSYAAGDGAYTVVGSFQRALAVTAAGVHVGNNGATGAQPGFTARVDYLFDAAAPIVPEDAPVDPPPGGEDPPPADTTPPVIGDASVDATSDTAVMTWTTDELASGAVDYGATASYELGSVPQSNAALTHQATLTGLQPGTVYHYRVTARDGAGNQSVSGDRTFTTAAPAAVTMTSDDFYAATLSPRWSEVDPVGDGTVSLVGSGTGDAHVALSLPAGSGHDPWKPNRALRLMQPTADVDFGLEAAFASVPSLKFQMQGVHVEQDAANWLRFDVYHDGTVLRAFAASSTAGTPKKQLSTVVAVTGAVRIVVDRAGSTWTMSYASGSGQPIVVGSFQHALQVSRTGVFAGNNGTAGAQPAFTALVDYVFDVDAPILPEDSGAAPPPPDPEDPPPGDNVAPVISGIRTNASATTAVVSWSTDEAASGAVDYGPTTAYGSGSVLQSNPGTTHQVTLTGLQANSTYHYRVTATDASGNRAQSPDAVFTTPAVDLGPEIDVWYGDDQSFGQNGVTQPWVNILGNVSDPAGVRSLSARINNGNSRALTLGPDERRLEYTGDFNVNVALADLLPGANTVVLTATDGQGAVSTRTVTVHRRASAPPAVPFTAPWTSSENLTDQATVVDGHWSVQDGAVRTAEVGYDRVLAVGDLSWTDYEVTFPVTVASLGPRSGARLSGAALVGMGMRWRGHEFEDRNDPPWGFHGTGSYAWFRWYSTPKLEMRGTDYSPSSFFNATLPFGVPHVFKGRAETVAGGTRYSFKMWPQNVVEPANWQTTILEDNGPASGSLALIAHHADTVFGPVSVTPLSGGQVAPLMRQAPTTESVTPSPTSDPTVQSVPSALTSEPPTPSTAEPPVTVADEAAPSTSTPPTTGTDDPTTTGSTTSPSEQSLVDGSGGPP
jgi:hypothetical protein